MHKRLLIIIGIALATLVGVSVWRKPWHRSQSEVSGPGSSPATEKQPQIAGSGSCRPCHQKFYQLWATSHHGLAMQPFTPELADREFAAAAIREITVGKAAYRAEWSIAGGVVRERSTTGEKSYSITQVMGGKNVYYFLTLLDRGRLQVLPLAYDVQRKTWFDTAASAMRHFTGIPEQPLDWRDPLYTFNTSCHGCHVSQLSTNYDPQSDSYNTVWAESGINCETCHGPSAEHVRVCQGLPEGRKPEDLKIIVTKSFTSDQHNASCSSCHAKASMLTQAFKPGDRFFDHFNLVTLENPDYYPDGRDLGENYTYTSWLMNPCAAKSKLHCVNCHTSSGRFRFPEGKSNESCLPCHEERVRNTVAHTHHQPDSRGNRCIGCHMPMTEFARMRRSDHSFRPPAPSATLAFKSPNACNLCHPDRDAVWADRQVRSWHKADYQARQIEPARLIEAASRRDWRRLPLMLEYLGSNNRDEVFAASLIRLLITCPDSRKIPALRRALQDRSPLVRASAATGLEGLVTAEVRNGLLALTTDDFRLVRIRAAGALAGYPPDQLGAKDRTGLEAAFQELETSLRSRPDDWSSHYNLGNYYSERREYQRAVESFTHAVRLRKDAVLPRVNAAIAYAILGQSAAAEQSLQQALLLEPANAAANFNLGLLKAEQGDMPQAESCLRTALKADPQMAPAAYNLGILLAGKRREETISWCRKAAQISPEEPKYSYTLAFYLNDSGKKPEAIKELQQLLARHVDYADAYRLLGAIYEERREYRQARALYQQALRTEGLPPEERQFYQIRLASLP